jgi:hypothetical protein
MYKSASVPAHPLLERQLRPRRSLLVPHSQPDERNAFVGASLVALHPMSSVHAQSLEPCGLDRRTASTPVCHAHRTEQPSLAAQIPAWLVAEREAQLAAPHGPAAE